MFYAGLILSAVIGLSLGLIGGGGSILTVPILVYFLGVEAHAAVVMSLAVVGATSMFGAFLHWTRGGVNFSSSMIFGISGIFGAFLGSPLTPLVAPPTLLLIFGGVMFAVAISMLRRTPHEVEDDAAFSEPNKAKAVLAGFGVGVLTGFLGVGGGFLIVPALIMFGGLAIKEAIGTSLVVISLNSAAGLIGHVSQKGDFDWTLTFAVTLLAVGGAALGAVLSHRLAAHRLQKMFAYLVLGVAIFLIGKNYAVLW